MIDSIETTGPVTRVRVIDVPDEEAAVAEALDTLWGGLGDYDEVVKHEEGVFEVIVSNGY